MVEVLYHFRDLPDVVATVDKRIFNKRTNRYLKKTVCGGSIGFWINRNFYTYGLLLDKKQNTLPYYINKREYKMPF